MMSLAYDDLFTKSFTIVQYIFCATRRYHVSEHSAILLREIEYQFLQAFSYIIYNKKQYRYAYFVHWTQSTKKDSYY